MRKPSTFAGWELENRHSSEVNQRTKCWLVVYLPLWKIWKSVGMSIPTIYEKKNPNVPKTVSLRATSYIGPQTLLGFWIYWWYDWYGSECFTCQSVVPVTRIVPPLGDPDSAGPLMFRTENHQITNAGIWRRSPNVRKFHQLRYQVFSGDYPLVI